jgi:hypothetical protein
MKLMFAKLAWLSIDVKDFMHPWLDWEIQLDCLVILNKCSPN